MLSAMLVMPAKVHRVRQACAVGESAEGQCGAYPKSWIGAIGKATTGLLAWIAIHTGGTADEYQSFAIDIGPCP